jgi:hypothetical protein
LTGHGTLDIRACTWIGQTPAQIAVGAERSDRR